MSVRTDRIELIVNINGNDAKNQLNELRKKTADVKFEMDSLKKGTQEYLNKKAEFAQLNNTVADLKKTIGITALTQKELTAELSKLKALKGSITPFSNEFKELEKQIKAVKSRLYDVSNGVQGFASFLSKIKDEVKQFGAVALGYLGFQALQSVFTGIIQGAAKLSDQLADLRRVAGLSAEQAKQLSTELGKIDTRTSVSNLRDIAIVAGKLGVAKDDIFGFTKAVDQLVVALGDELGDADAITTKLGKILNVFDGKITGDNISKLGNAIVDLANKGVATGGFVVEFTQRLSGLAKTSGFSLSAILGLGAGLEENGAKVESASTAISKLINKIGTDVPAAAKIAGKDFAEFSELFSKKPQEALLLYAAGLQKNKASFAEIAASFKDAGEEGARVISTLATLGIKTDFFREKMDESAKAISNTGAITAAFALKNETFGAVLDKLGKQFYQLGINSSLATFAKGAVVTLSELFKFLAAMPAPIVKLISAFAALTVGMAIMNSGMIQAAKLALINAAATIKNTIAAYAHVTAQNLSKLAQSAALATQAAYIVVTNLLTGSITLATAATRLFAIVTKTGLGPISALAVAIGGIVAVANALGEAFKTTAQDSKFMAETMRLANEETSKEQSAIQTLTAVIKDKALGLQTNTQALKDLIALNPEYLHGLTLDNIANADGKKILDDYNASLNTNANLKAASLIKDREFDKNVKLRSTQQELAIAEKAGTGFGDLSDEAKGAFSQKTSVGRTAFTSDLFNAKISASDFKEAMKGIQEDIDKSTANVTAATENYLGKQKEKSDTRQQFLLHQVTVNKTAMLKLEKGTVEYTTALSNYNDSLTKYYAEFGYKGQAKAATAVSEDTLRTIAKLRKEITALDEALEAFATTDSEGIKKNRASRQLLEDELDKLLGKTKKEKADKKPGEHSLNELLKEAAAFRKKIDELTFQGVEASKSADQKEIDSVKHKFEVILKDYDVLVKKLNAKGKEILGPKAPIIAAAAKELEAVTVKQQQAALLKSYQDQQKASDQFYEEEKNAQAQRFVNKEISKRVYDANIAHIDAESKTALLKLAQDYAAKTVTLDGKQVVAVEQAAKDVTKFKKEELEKQTRDLIEFYKAQEAERKLIDKLDDQAATAKIETKINIAGGTGNVNDQLKAQKELLTLQRKQKLEALQEQRDDAIASITEEGEAANAVKAQIEADYIAIKAKIDSDNDEAVTAAEDAAVQRKIAAVRDFADQVQSITAAGFTIANNLANKELAREKKVNDAKALGYKKLLDHKLISQHQYDKLIEKQDKEYAKKKHEADLKAFKQQQVMAITAALINGALAVVSTLAARPGMADILTLGVARAIQVGLVIAATAAQIGTIATAQAPEAGEGGLLKEGPYHKDKEKGLHVVNPRTGKTELLLEKDEMVIKGKATRSNKIYTVTGTPAQIGSKLNEVHGGVSWTTGAKIEIAKWRTEKAPVINFNMPKIMEQGGIIRPISNSLLPSKGDDTQLTSLLTRNNELLEMQIHENRTAAQKAIEEHRNAKERLHAVVSIKEYRAEEAKYEAARKSSSLKQ